MLSVIVGDFVHNLRSVLDHLAWQLVLVSGGTPSERTQFPIFISERVSGGPLAAWQRMTAGMNDLILSEVHRVQPYTAGDNAPFTSLAILNALSNEDKHRLPLACVSAVARHAEGSTGIIEEGNVEVLSSEILTGSTPGSLHLDSWRAPSCRLRRQRRAHRRRRPHLHRA